MNSSETPRIVRKGEIIVELEDANDVLDCPSTADELSKMCHHAEVLYSFVQGQMETGNDEDEEILGPKTAEVPDPTVYPASKLRDLIDVGNLSEHLNEQVWKMLEKNIDAFGFDG
ncbi:hypothetical protein EV421DRAFT_1906738 [Armillaria borealis]|uniref:Uncharacterized protein n=1 Tax=Armillaria borealis TaxID=47425 RepID=A0AA39MLE4_9AGAR|nr:hypothetical protein EV421DRAFT_1906738 [Armillaria borealis]